MNPTNKQSQPFFKVFFSNFGEKLQTAIVRFPMTFVCILTVAVLFVLVLEKIMDDIYTHHWIMAGIVSAFATLTVSLFGENRWKNKLISIVINIVIIGLLAFLFSGFSLPVTEANVTQFVMLLACFILAMFFAGYISSKSSLRWWDNLQDTLFQLIISAFFAGILMAGLSLALVSLDKLFGINIKDKVYMYLAVFCFVIFMPSYFLSQLRTKTTSDDASFSITYPMIFKIFGLYILLPILAIYTLILYGYLIKIIAIWELPNGWVSWLVSILGFLGFIAMIILHPMNVRGEHKITGFYARFFPIILLPLLVLMFVGIVRRFSDYGITINRLLVLILNLWFITMSVYLFISRSRQPKWILISFSTVALLSAVGPWSVLRFTENSLKKELSQLLTDADWQDNTDTYKPVEISKEKQIRLSDIAYYLQRTYGIESIRPMFSSLGETATAISLITRLGISEEGLIKDNYFSYHVAKTDFNFELNDFKTAYYLKKQFDNDIIYKSDDLTITLESANINISTKETPISLIPFIETLTSTTISTNQTSLHSKTSIYSNNEYYLVIFDIDGRIKSKDEIEIYSFKGLLLLK